MYEGFYEKLFGGNTPDQFWKNIAILLPIICTKRKLRVGSKKISLKKSLEDTFGKYNRMSK